MTASAGCTSELRRFKVRDHISALCEFAVGLRFEDLPSNVIERAKQVVADTMAVISAGAREAEVRTLTQRLLEDEQKEGGSSTLLGSGRKTDALTAALINGTAGTFLELDEGNQFGRGHPAIHVLPAILALAEARELSGPDLITALVVGYEIGTRIGIAAKIRMSMHPHGTWGTVGAATAVGKLLGYDRYHMAQMINLSSSLALATSRKTMLEGATVRNVYSGISNHMGILAHQLISSGFTGEADGLSTVYGAVISDTFDTHALTAELGTRFEIARNYFKQHACCRYNHATLDALLEIMGRFSPEKLTADQIAEVKVSTYSLAAQLCDQQPGNMLAAKFSIPFAVATTLVNGHTGVSSFSPQAVTQESIRTLARRVQVTEDPSLTAMMPGRRPSRVEVILTDGQVLKAEAYLNKGDFEDPYSIEDLEKKYFSLAVPAWGDAAARKIHEAIGVLETVKDINEITRHIVAD
jgi:2-methylcitrate dehydratase PrpD